MHAQGQVCPRVCCSDGRSGAPLDASRCIPNAHARRPNHRSGPGTANAVAKHVAMPCRRSAPRRSRQPAVRDGRRTSRPESARLNHLGCCDVSRGKAHGQNPRRRQGSPPHARHAGQSFDRLISSGSLGRFHKVSLRQSGRLPGAIERGRMTYFDWHAIAGRLLGRRRYAARERRSGRFSESR